MVHKLWGSSLEGSKQHDPALVEICTVRVLCLVYFIFLCIVQTCINTICCAKIVGLNIFYRSIQKD